MPSWVSMTMQFVSFQILVLFRPNQISRKMYLSVCQNVIFQWNIFGNISVTMHCSDFSSLICFWFITWPGILVSITAQPPTHLLSSLYITSSLYGAEANPLLNGSWVSTVVMRYENLFRSLMPEGGRVASICQFGRIRPRTWLASSAEEYLTDTWWWDVDDKLNVEVSTGTGISRCMLH